MDKFARRKRPSLYLTAFWAVRRSSKLSKEIISLSQDTGKHNIHTTIVSGYSSLPHSV